MTDDANQHEVLSIHHGGAVGGAPTSLALQAGIVTRQGRTRLTIAAHRPEIHAFFERHGQTVRGWPDPLVLLGKVCIGWTVLRTRRQWSSFLRETLLLPLSVWRQWDALRRSSATVVHLNSAVLLSSAIAARLAGKPVVWHVREASTPPRCLRRFMRGLATRMVCISPVEAEVYGSRHPKVRVVYNPVDFARFDPDRHDRVEARRQLGIPTDARVAISLGGVVPRKGAKEIAEAIAELDNDLYAIIAGPALKPDGGPYHDRVAEALGVAQDRVIFTGPVDDPARLLAASDLLIFAGTSPHFPRPVYEAWAMRLPVVVFDVRGVSENVDHDVDGWIVSPRTGPRLAEALRQAWRASARFDDMGLRGREKALDRTGCENSGAALEAILHDAATTRPCGDTAQKGSTA